MTKSELKCAILLFLGLIVSGCGHASIVCESTDAPLANSSLAQFEGDPQRLQDDIERTFRQLHWGKLYIRPRYKLVYAQALLANGRTAAVVAGPTPNGKLRAKVRIGHFGDRQLEQRFIRTLVNTLAGEPKR